MKAASYQLNNKDIVVLLALGYNLTLSSAVAKSFGGIK